MLPSKLRSFGLIVNQFAISFRWKQYPWSLIIPCIILSSRLFLNQSFFQQSKQTRYENLELLDVVSLGIDMLICSIWCGLRVPSESTEIRHFLPCKPYAVSLQKGDLSSREWLQLEDGEYWHEQRGRNRVVWEEGSGDGWRGKREVEWRVSVELEPWGRWQYCRDMACFGDQQEWKRTLCFWGF